MKRKANDADAPSPEQLAAYLDGELDLATRARVAQWLETSPAAGALEPLRRLNQVWQDAPCPEPSPAAWDGVLQRIVAATAEPVVVASAPAPLSAGGWSWHLRMAGVAAAILVTTLLLVRPGTQQNATAPGPQAVRVLRVAGDDDIEIISMEAADIDILVVGQPPVRGPFVLAMPGDVILESIGPDPTDGMMPQVRNMEQSNPDGPMILAPLGLASNR